MIYLRQSDYDAMVAWARQNLPAEACGLLAGERTGALEARVERVWLLENADASSEHFTITPADQLRALREARAEGLAMLGNWHSHPQTPSRPSEEDKRLANDTSAFYLILSLAGPEPVLRAFTVDAQKTVGVVPIEVVA